MTERTLTRRELNRATLARQLLLRRAALEPVEAIERLVALQAQEPASPYVCLWTRLEDFRAAALHRAFLDRRAVKATLMRVTLHAVSAGDFSYFWPALAGSLRLFRERWRRAWADGLAVESLADQALAYASKPRTNTEMRNYLERIAGRGEERDAWWGIRLHAPFVHVPDGPAWSFGRRPRLIAARSWLDRPLASPDDGLDHLVRRYLRGFGPATVDDIFQFTRVERARLKHALERLAPELQTFRDERGRLLHDVPDAELPAIDTPAPVRFLAMWDSVLLAYEDRSRILPEAYRRRVIQTNGDVLPSFLVDGFVAGLWRAQMAHGRTRITWEPFAKVTRAVERQLEDEADRLAAFVEPVEPEVYRRYSKMWTSGRQPVGGRS